VKPDVNSVEVHPQLSHSGHRVVGVLVGAGSVWPTVVTCTLEEHGLDVGLTMQYDGFVICSLYSPVIPYLK
jgi:hypothetical protein